MNFKVDIKNVIDSARRHQFVKLHRGASDEEIKDALAILAVRLPRNYICFLKECGWADLNGDIVYGLGPDVTKAESMFENSVWEHVRATPQLRTSLIPLMNDGAGNHECLDTKKIKDGDCPVVLWRHDHPRGELQVPKLVSKSFALWLRKKIRELPEVV